MLMPALASAKLALLLPARVRPLASLPSTPLKTAVPLSVATAEVS